MAGAHTTLIMLLILLNLQLINSSSYHDEWTELSCGPNEPIIRFPFQLVKESSQDQCVYPEFCLYCTKNKRTMIVLSSNSGPIKFFVTQIMYEYVKIYISDPDNCFPKMFLDRKLNNSSFLPYYRFPEESESTVAFFNCSSVKKRHLRNQYQINKDSQDMITCPIYASYSDESVVKLDLASCTKMIEVSATIDANHLSTNSFSLSWHKTNCDVCEAKGMKCRWNTNSSKRDIECFNRKRIRKTIYIPNSLIFASTGSIILGLVIIAITKIYLHFRGKKEDQVRIDKFLDDFRAQKPARFSYADIKTITGGFKEKLGEGAHGTVFKGKLSSDILVAVKILNNTQGEEAAQISLGIAKGIEYLHEGCSHPILHFDINPHNVLLDETFTPKISDFGLAKLCSKNISVVSMTAARGTLGYMAPEVLSRNFGNVSLKSDIYSYGMLLLEMVGGRKNVDSSSAETFHSLYREWIYNLLEGDIYMNIEDEGDAKFAKKLAIVGLWCIQWQPMNRPSIKTVIQMLETEDDSQLTFPPNPFHSTNSITTSEGSLARRPFQFQMEVIQE
ncbi:receptor-like kinase [Medicago truncatula]|uniref:Receptor-like kinase n=1 Tax=Medicago truncatula TaxID=3880 RepID=A0A072VEX7_MEDTR|nr:receptor-like kinase [Medicago truncatula]